ncbi:hypothetical protein ACWD5F_16795 [Streptomyces sp. NPDC002499]
MIKARLLSTAFAVVLDQVIQNHYGGLGLLCLLVVGLGIKAHRPTWASAGAVMLVLLMMQA